MGSVGNGGFSLRKKAKMLEIIDAVPYTNQNEDLYFSSYKNLYKPSAFEAMRFSVEEVFSPESFGCHKPWNRGFDRELLRIYPELNELYRLHNVSV